MKNLTKNNIIAYALYIGVMVLLPGIIGGVLALSQKDLIYLEVIYVVFGLIDIMIITVRIRMRDSRNYKKDKTIVEDKNAPEFKKWLMEQYLIAIIGAIDLVISLIVFGISCAI